MIEVCHTVAKLAQSPCRKFEGKGAAKIHYFSFVRLILLKIRESFHFLITQLNALVHIRLERETWGKIDRLKKHQMRN